MILHKGADAGERLHEIIETASRGRRPEQWNQPSDTLPGQMKLITVDDAPDDGVSADEEKD